MQTNENIPSSSMEVREYVKNRHAVWTILPKGSSVNRREVVIKGYDQQGSAMEVARHVASKCSPWVTRVQVIKWEKNEFIAWLNIKKDEIYEFVAHFNARKCVKNAKAFVKRGLDNDKKLVLYGVEGKTEEEVSALIGVDKVQQVMLTNNTAFVTMKSQTYAQALIGDSTLNVKMSKYVEKREEPVGVINKKLETTKRQLTIMVETLTRRVAKLEQELKNMTKGPATQDEALKKKRRIAKRPSGARSKEAVESSETVNPTLDSEETNWESGLHPRMREEMQTDGDSPQRGRSKSTSALSSSTAFQELAELCLNTPVNSNRKRCSNTQLDEHNEKKRQLVNTPLRLPQLRRRTAPENEVQRSDQDLC